MKKGMLYTISAPSGTGKTTLISELLKNDVLKNLKTSISYTTRKKRLNEKNHFNYYFISKKKFCKMIKRNVFLEYASIFGNYYGTCRTTIENNINSGINTILDIDWQGVYQIKKKISSVSTIFILPPSIIELKNRLYKRGVTNNEDIKKRLSNVINEIKHYFKYDYIIVNDNFKFALRDLKSIICNNYIDINRKKKQFKILNELIKSL